MAKRKKKGTLSKYKKKRKQFAPRENSKTVSLILRGPMIVPDEMFVKVRYRLNFSHTGTAFILSQISGNNENGVVLNISGPNRAMGIEEWSQFYSTSQVIGSRVNVEALMDVDMASKTPVQIALAPYNGVGNPPTNLQEVAELPYANTHMMSENNTRSRTLNKYMSTRKILGYHGSIDDVEFTQSPTDTPADPVLVWRWALATEALGSSAYTCYFQGYVDYYLRLFKRRTLGVGDFP